MIVPSISMRRTAGRVPLENPLPLSSRWDEPRGKARLGCIRTACTESACRRRVQLPTKWRSKELSARHFLINPLFGSCNHESVRRVEPIENGLSREEFSDLLSTIRRCFRCPAKGAHLQADLGPCSNQPVLVGLIDKFEMWAPETFEKQMKAYFSLAESAFSMF